MLHKRFIPFVIYGLMLLVVISLPYFVRLLTDWYWFQNIGFSNIFTTILVAKLLLGLAVGFLVFAVIAGNFLLIGRLTKLEPQYVSINPIKQIISKKLKTLSWFVSLIIAFLTGLASAGNWQVVLKYFNATDFNELDPIFSRDLSFYFFKLPLLEFLFGLCLGIVIIIFIGTIFIYSLRGGLTFGQGKVFSISKAARIHYSIIGLFFFILTAARIYFIRIPNLVYSRTGPFIGANYTDIHALLPFLKTLIFITLIIALLCLINVFKSFNRLVFAGIGFYFLVFILGTLVYPTVVQKLIVLPNELVKETPYLEHHIQATRKAFNLDKVTERDLTGETTLTIDDINKNQSTIKNVRLWDREPLLDTFSQLQEIRTYYDFASIDNDRYQFNGDYRQVLLSPRELNSSSLPQRNFINEHLTFTHGFGLTLGPVNEVTSEGLPVLFLKDLPPVSAKESLKISRPEIYYGELSNDYVVVNTETKEFDYPAGDENVFTKYQGQGGVKINSIFRKLLFALRFKSFKIFLSNDITSDSRIMYYRDIQSRVRRVLPFLRFDADPYLVVTQDGKLKWIIDAYTTDSQYPYAQLTADLNQDFQQYAFIKQINYIRNSVKIVLDAYDGQMQFYIADSEDPLIRTYAKIFKNSFLPIDQMDKDLKAHIRYPEDLFTYQTNLYTVYHMDEVQIFYNKEDQWEVPFLAEQERTDPIMRHMIMKLPGEEKEEFILMIPFTPRGKDNLSAWMVARNDGQYYGQLVVYRFPKQKLVFGPKQIVNRINQDTEVSRQLTLWDQRGSEVIKGNLLVIPIEKSLLYVQPIYLRAEGGRIPELKRVIVAYESQIAMEETLDLALEKIFTFYPLPAKGKGVEGKVVPPPVKEAPQQELIETNRDLIKQAQEYYQNALEAQRRGDWAVYGQEIEKLGQILQQLQD